MNGEEAQQNDAPKWGDPLDRLTQERKDELATSLWDWKPETATEDLPGPFAGDSLSGLDVFWLAACSVAGPNGDVATSSYVLRDPPSRPHSSDAGFGVSIVWGGTELPDPPSVLNLHLEGADLSNIHLEGAYLLDAHLEGAQFISAHLEGAYLQRAHLERADLIYANLEGADLRFAHLERARLSFVKLTGVMLNEANLKEARLNEAHLEVAKMQQCVLEGANLRQAHMEGANLRQAHMEGADLDLAYLHGAILQSAHLESANLRGAHLERSNLAWARLQGGYLYGAHAEGSNLRGSHLESADLREMQLEGKHISSEELARLQIWIPGFPAILFPALLPAAYFDISTDLRGITLGDGDLGFVSLASVHWGGADLSVVKWFRVPGQPPRKRLKWVQLGDERIAREAKDEEGKPKDATTRLDEFEAAARANRQLANALRDQGINDDADRFAYQAQVLQRIVLRRQGRYGAWIGSHLLDRIAGYGYKPGRSLFTYLAVLLVFAGLYLLAGNGLLTFGLPPSQYHTLPWYEALILSVSSFHGRGFFQPLNSPGDPVAILASIEAIFGLFIEVSFIATFTQRFFGK